MDDGAFRENARVAIDPEELENLIRVSEALIERAKALMKTAEAAIYTSEMLAMESRQIHHEIARRRAANCRPTGARTDPYEHLEAVSRPEPSQG